MEEFRTITGQARKEEGIGHPSPSKIADFLYLLYLSVYRNDFSAPASPTKPPPPFEFSEI